MSATRADALRTMTMCIFADNYNNLHCAESLATQVHRLHFCASFSLSLSLMIHVTCTRLVLAYIHICMTM